MKLKYPISYSVERQDPFYPSSTQNLINGFSRWWYTSGPTHEKASETQNKKTAVRHAKNHGGSVVAYWLADRESRSPVARSRGYRGGTYSRKTVFGPKVREDQDNGNGDLSDYLTD